jgi:hypothetical protein
VLEPEKFPINLKPASEVIVPVLDRLDEAGLLRMPRETCEPVADIELLHP